MSPTLSLKDMERKIWTAYFEDGLWDIFFASLMLTDFVRAYTDSLWAYLVMAAGFAVFFGGKRFITTPRLGRVKFGPRREARRQKLVLFILGAVLLTAAVFLLPMLGFTFEAGNWVGIMLAVMVTAVFLLMAYLMDFRRLYFYAFLMGGAMFATELFGQPAGMIAHLVAGLLMLIVGLTLLVRFRRQYQIPEVN